MRRIILSVILYCLLPWSGIAQTGDKLYDGRQTPYCSSCIRLIQEMPKEVLFGVHINSSGEVIFSINNSKWFAELLTSPTDGIAVDLVPKDIFGCNRKNLDVSGLAKGFVLPIVYLTELQKRKKDIGGGQFSFLIGMVPAALKDKELEGNLAIIKNGTVCFYTFFVDIPRSVWDFLPMGLFADSLVNTSAILDDNTRIPFPYSNKIQFSIPFTKNKALLSEAAIQPLYDSIRIGNYAIQKIDIQAFSSIEGEADINKDLQQKRAEAITKGLQKKQAASFIQTVNVNENWSDFYKDIPQSTHPEFASLSQADIRIKLLDRTVADELEPILRKHRKALITLYVKPKNEWTDKQENTLLEQFKVAIEKKEIYKASQLQEEIFGRISTNQLPSDFLDRLEIPMEKSYISLLTQKETYKYQLALNDEREAIDHFKYLLQLDPENGRVLYNICSLNFVLWKYDSSFIDPVEFHRQLKSLESKNIPTPLVKRMLINYHIRMCEIYLARYDYSKKDSSVAYIRSSYKSIVNSDPELVSLAKYLSYYSHREWAIEILKNRVGEPDASEDILFYYINLCLFNPEAGADPFFSKVAAQAIKINKERYCTIFSSVQKGGASFQLLGYEELKKIYCQSCSL